MSRFEAKKRNSRNCGLSRIDRYTLPHKILNIMIDIILYLNARLNDVIEAELREASADAKMSMLPMTEFECCT
jgi:hypothetical protein